MNKQNHKKDFVDFLISTNQTPPDHVSESILKTIQNELETQKTFWVLAKFLFLQFSSGLITLTLCPQFGIGPWGGIYGVTHFFMEIGPWACALFCSLFYFTLSQSLGIFLLIKKERFLIERKRFFIFPIAVIFSFITLSMLGLLKSQQSMYFTQEFIFIWLVAGLVWTQILFSINRWVQARF